MSSLKRKLNSNEVVVNRKSNFKSHLIKCQNILDSTNFNEVVIKAMGKATPRAANLAVQLNANNHNTFQLQVKTYNVEIIEDQSRLGKPILGGDKDGFDPDSIDISVEKITDIPGLEIRVRKNELEIKAMEAARRRGLLKEDRFI